MAHYAHGQGPQGQYNHAQATAQPFTPPAAYNAQFSYSLAHSQEIRRMPSLDPSAARPTAGQRADAYGGDPRSERLRQEEFPQAQAYDNPSIQRASSHASAFGAYRPENRQPARSTYNPQDFAPFQSSQDFQPYSQGYAAAYGGAYQPYHPAGHPSPSVWGNSRSSYQAPGQGVVASSPHLGSATSLPSTPSFPHGGHAASWQGYSHPHSPYAPQQQLDQPQSPAPFSHPLPSPPHPEIEPYNPSAYSPPAPPPPPVPPGWASFQSQGTFPLPTSNPASGSQPSPTPLGPLPYDPWPPQDSMSRLREEEYDSRYYDSSGAEANDVMALPPPLPAPSHPLPSPPVPVPPQHNQLLDGNAMHPQLRPLPGPPPDVDPIINGEAFYDDRDSSDWDETTDEELVQEKIWREVEAAVMTDESSAGIVSHSARTGSQQAAMGSEPRESRSTSGSANSSSPEKRAWGHANGHFAAPESGQAMDSDDYDEADQAEAANGLAAMRLAEEEEAATQAVNERHQATLPNNDDSERAAASRDGDDESSGSDFANFDVGLYEGGYCGRMSYGTNPSDATPGRSGWAQGGLGLQSVMPAPDSANVGQGGASSGALHSNSNSIGGRRPLPSAPVSTPGGASEFSGRPLLDTRQRKLSFDAGDEASWHPGRNHVAASPGAPKDEFPDIFYHPGMKPSSPERPLPPLPSHSTQSQVPTVVTPTTFPGQSPHLNASERSSYVAPSDVSSGHMVVPTGLAVPRSSSLSSHTSTPQLVPPVRSKTDADERRARLLKQQQLGIYSATGDAVGSQTSIAQSTVALDLPAIPAGKRKRFNPQKLSSAEFRKCSEPWALSSIAAWVKDLAEEETDLKETTIVNGIVALFTHKIPTMNTADAETLSARVVQDMFAAGVLVRDEEWVKFGTETLVGVIWQLTGSGCYAPRLHGQEMAGRCYAHHCSRTLKKINLQAQVIEPERKLEDWATFHKIKKEDYENVPRKEVERQNILHEIVQTEDQYMDQLNVLLCLYRDQLLACQPPIIQPTRMEKFVRDVFGRVDAVKKANEDYLLAQLKYRQQEQTPWIVGYSDIFREWVRKAKTAYIDYAAAFPRASLTIRKEAERNILFRQFLEDVRDNERSKRLGWDTYLKAPITRLQRYGLLLHTVLKNMTQDTEEKTNLQIAIEEIKVVTMECDARVAEMSKKIDLTELEAKLKLRPGMHGVELNLNHLGRELIFEGDLQRTGANRFTWLETHAILFDHYLVLAKTNQHKNSVTGLKDEEYDVSKLPIPMDLLVLESSNDDPVVKSSVRGIGAVTTVTTRAPISGDTRHNRSMSDKGMGPGALSHSNTNGSASTTASNASNRGMVTTTVLEGSRDEKVLYPFRIKHLGQDVYTLYAPTSQSRQDWCDKILEAKTKHAAALFAQNAEPFRLRVVADTAFAFDFLSGGTKGVTIKGTPLDRAVREAESFHDNAGPRPGPVCRAAVNCATSFVPLYGERMVAIGTDYGVYVSSAGNPRGWNRVIQMARVTQIAVLEEFSLFLIIADKSLIAYHLDLICPLNGNAPKNESLTRAPQKISGNREVGFFATGKIKDRTLVFYKKRDGISSVFKVLEPVYHKATEKKSRFSRKGTTEFFREYDEFYVPSECFGINVFRSYLAVATARGFDVLNLDKKLPVAVPDLKLPDVAHIAQLLEGQRPLGMFRLNNTEFLLAYDACAVYANQHGDVSRSAVMTYVDKARSAAMYGPYLLLFNADYVEIRNAENGRRRQVIAGRDIKCLDDAQTGSSAGQRTIKFALQHPEVERMQLVLELVLNDGQRD